MRVPCEFCGVPCDAWASQVEKHRIACKDCRGRVEWCPVCDGAGCAMCGMEGTSPSAGCQKVGRAYCEEVDGETACYACAVRLAEARACESEQRAEYAREIGGAA